MEDSVHFKEGDMQEGCTRPDTVEFGGTIQIEESHHPDHFSQGLAGNGRQFGEASKAVTEYPHRLKNRASRPEPQPASKILPPFGSNGREPPYSCDIFTTARAG